MNRKIPFGACLVLIFIAIILTFQIVTVTNEVKYNKIVSDFTSSPPDNPKIAEIQKLVDKYFVKEIDEEYLSDATVYGYLLGLGDKHVGYFTADSYKEYVSELQGSFTGIGIRVALETIDDTERAVIFEVMDNSPAKEAGIKIGDVLYAVDGTLYSELGYDEAINRMLGAEGETLRFSVMRNTKIVDFEIVRRYFESQLVSYKLTDANANIGYIRIYQFGTATVWQFKNAVEALRNQGATKFIFDLRNNPGGEFNSILSVLDYLLPEGEIVITTDKSGKEKVYTSDASCIKDPIVILIDGATASAAELFTAALRDYDMATLIGTTTYGKGTVQSTYPLSDGSAVKFSTEYYLPPSRISYDETGIEPDITVEFVESSSTNLYLLKEADDVQLMAAIEELIK